MVLPLSAVNIHINYPVKPYESNFAKLKHRFWRLTSKVYVWYKVYCMSVGDDLQHTCMLDVLMSSCNSLTLALCLQIPVCFLISSINEFRKIHDISWNGVFAMTYNPPAFSHYFLLCTMGLPVECWSSFTMTAVAG